MLADYPKKIIHPDGWTPTLRPMHRNDQSTLYRFLSVWSQKTGTRIPSPAAWCSTHRGIDSFLRSTLKKLLTRIVTTRQGVILAFEETDCSKLTELRNYVKVLMTRVLYQKPAKVLVVADRSFGKNYDPDQDLLVATG